MPRVVAVGLDRHYFEGVADIPRLQQLNREPGLSQRCMEPLRQRSGFQADPRQIQVQCSKPRDQILRFAGDLALANDFAVAIDNAEA